MNIVDKILFFAFTSMHFSACSGNYLKIDIDKSNLSEYNLYVNENKTTQDSFAAAYLQSTLINYFQLNSKIVSNIARNQKYIIIGSNPFNDIEIEKFSKALKGESFAIQLDDNGNIYLFGGEKRSSAYAVFSFIENELGLVNYFEDKYYNKNYNFKKIKVNPRFEVPAFQYRSVQLKGAVNRHFSSFNKLNPLFFGSNLNFEEIGGNDVVSQSCGFGHTFDCIIPEKKYYKSNPEFFSIYKGMDKNNYSGQLCLSNDTVYNLVKKDVVSVMTMYPSNSFYNFTPNDRDRTCECSRCSKINLEEKSTSGTLIRFINRLANEFEDIYPKLKWHTLSYLDTGYGPSKTKVHSSVFVSISTDTITWDLPYKNLRESKLFKNRVLSWKKSTDNLIVYDYSCNFMDYFKIYPDIYRTSDNLKYFKELGLKGVLIESIWEHYNVADSELKAYIYAKLFWNPNLNVQNLILDFNHYYYGKESSKHINRFYNLLYSDIEKYKHLNSEAVMSAFDCSDIQEMVRIINEVDNLKLEDETKHKIRKWKMPILYSLVKYKNNCLESNDYLRFVKEVEQLFSIYKIKNLGNFNKNLEDFVFINKSRAEFFNQNKITNRAKVEDVILIDASKFIIVNPNKDNTFYPSIIIDKSASSGIAVNLPPKSGDWLVRFEHTADLKQLQHANKISLRLRINKVKNEGWGVMFGAYNKVTKKNEFEHHIPINELSSSYKVFEYDAGTIHKDLIYYVGAIPNNNINSIIIDNISFKK